MLRVSLLLLPAGAWLWHAGHPALATVAWVVGLVLMNRVRVTKADGGEIEREKINPSAH